MSEQNHTTTPWRVEVKRGGLGDVQIYDAAGDRVFTFPNHRRALAETFVRAVNAHKALVEALKALLPRCDFEVERERNTCCGAYATRVGTFGTKRCPEHPFNYEAFEMEEAIAGIAALALAEASNERS